jgi:serine/threonine protein kinase
MSKDPKTEEFIMVLRFAEKGSLGNNLKNNFKNILWKEKIRLSRNLLKYLRELHKVGYFHKDFHSGNILQTQSSYYISDFGLTGPANKQKSDNKIYGVLPYVDPEVLSGKPYTSSSDIYSFGILMTELSSGNPPFCNEKHDISLALSICKGLRPEFGKGTPEIYKKLAYKCMSANSNERPTADELHEIFQYWISSIRDDTDEEEKFGYKSKEIKKMFEEADKEIPNISTSYKKNSNAIYSSRAFTFSNLLPNPVNSSNIDSHVDNEEGIFYYFKTFILKKILDINSVV